MLLGTISISTNRLKEYGTCSNELFLFKWSHRQSIWIEMRPFQQEYNLERIEQIVTLTGKSQVSRVFSSKLAEIL